MMIMMYLLVIVLLIINSSNAFYQNSNVRISSRSSIKMADVELVFPNNKKVRYIITIIVILYHYHYLLSYHHTISYHYLPLRWP